MALVHRCNSIFLCLLLALGIGLGFTPYSSVILMTGWAGWTALLCLVVAVVGACYAVNRPVGYFVLPLQALLFLAPVFSDYPFQTIHPTLMLAAALGLSAIICAEGKRWQMDYIVTPLILGVMLFCMWDWVASGYPVGDFGGPFHHQNYLGGFLALSVCTLPSLGRLYLSKLSFRMRVCLTGAGAVIFCASWFLLAYASGCRALIFFFAGVVLWQAVSILRPKRKHWAYAGGAAAIILLLIVLFSPWEAASRSDMTRLSWYAMGLSNSFSLQPQGFGTFGITQFSHSMPVPMSHTGALQLHSAWIELVYAYGLSGWLILTLIASGVVWAAKRAYSTREGQWEASLLFGFAVFSLLDTQYDVLPSLVILSVLLGFFCKSSGLDKRVAKSSAPRVVSATLFFALISYSTSTIYQDLREREALRTQGLAALPSIANTSANFAYAHGYAHALTAIGDAQSLMEASAFYKRALELAPDYVPSYSGMARAQEQHIPRLSIHYWNEVLKRVPGHSEALFGIVRLSQSPQLRELAWAELVLRHPTYLAWTGGPDVTQLPQDALPLAALRESSWSTLRKQGDSLERKWQVLPTKFTKQSLDRSRYLPEVKEQLMPLIGFEPPPDITLTGSWPRQSPPGIQRMLLRQLQLPSLQETFTWEHNLLTYLSWALWHPVYGNLPEIPSRDWDQLEMDYASEK